MVVIASARPQGSRFDVEDDSSDDIAVIPTRGVQSDPLSAIIRSLSQSPRQLEGFSGQRRPSQGSQGSQGSRGGILRLLLNLVGSELGLDNLNGELLDGVDEEVLFRNLFRAFTSIVGNVILR